MKKGKLLKFLAVSAIALSTLGGMTTAQAQEQELLIYSNSLSDGRSEWIEEQAAEQGFTLSFVDAGGGDVLNRLVAEAAAPQADIVFGLDESMFMQLEEEQLLVEHIPAWVDQVSEDANIGNGFFIH